MKKDHNLHFTINRDFVNLAPVDEIVRTVVNPLHWSETKMFLNYSSLIGER